MILSSQMRKNITKDGVYKMTEYEKLVLKALAQILRVIGNPQNDKEKYDCERIAEELDRNTW
jgi:hypothetical protein